MPQTSYASSMTKGFPGMKAESRQDGFDRSFYNAEASAEMPFGICVAQGTGGDPDCLPAILPASAAAKLVGVVVHSQAYDSRIDFGTTGLKPKVTLSIMARGSIWVTVEEAVTPGDPAYVRHTASGGNTQKGAFRKSADTATAIICGNSKFASAAGIGELALLHVDIV